MVAASSFAARFEELFGGRPRIFRAPGRVNLIGEHTDYNDGFVMPAAVQFATESAARPTADRRIAVHSLNFGETVSFDLDEAGPRPRGHWSDYVRGVAIVVERAGLQLRGANLLIRGGVPLGAGLSSSAALEVSVAFALLQIAGIHLDPAEIARLCQRAENEFAGVRCGIMDQFTACRARAHHALRLDCRSLEACHVPSPESARLVVSNCEREVRALSRFLPGIRALRDVNLDQLDQFASALDLVVFAGAAMW